MSAEMETETDAPGAALLAGAGPATGDAGDAAGEHARRQSTWVHTSFLVAGEIVGTGIMGLPFATARLG